MKTGRILIVDDERFFRDLYRDVLEARGHVVRLAASAQECMQSVAGESYDLVLTDLVMPGVDGFSLVSEMKGLDPELEVVVVTGRDDVRLAVRAMKAGCADFLTKPVDRDELVIVAERAMERGQLRREHSRLLSENIQFLKAQALYRQCLEILATLDLERLQDLSLQILARVTDAQGAAIWIADDRGQLGLRGYRGLVDRAALPARVDPRAPPFAEAFKSGHPFALRPTGAKGGPRGEGFWLPLVSGDDPVGLVLLTDRASGRFGDEEFSTSRAIGDFAAIAVRNARRFQALERVGLRDRDTAAYHLAYFVDYAGKEFYKARRYGRTFATLVLAIDNADEVRRHAGRDLFQRGMRALVATISRILRDADILAKVAEHEYYLLLPETDAFGAAMFVRRAREAVRREDAVRELADRCPIQLSVGAASFPKDGEDFDELLHWCRERMEEQRGSLLRRVPPGHPGEASFWDLVELLLGDRFAIPDSSTSTRGRPDPALFSAVQREAAREIGRDPKARGLLYVGARDRVADSPVLAGLDAVDPATRVYLMGRRSPGVEPRPNPLVTMVFLDADPRVASHDFLFHLSEHASYGLLQRIGPDGGRLFHTSDGPLVDALVERLQALYDLQPY